MTQSTKRGENLKKKNYTFNRKRWTFFIKIKKKLRSQN